MNEVDARCQRIQAQASTSGRDVASSASLVTAPPVEMDDPQLFVNG